MTELNVWTLPELTRDAEAAKALFRERRLEEPLQLYSEFFESFKLVFESLIDQLPSLVDEPPDFEALANVVQDADTRTAFRYLAALPVSEDDLKTLAETTLSAAALRSDPRQARRVRDTVLHMIDPYRFPWMAEQRSPTEEERSQAIIASAAQVAVRKVETARRSTAKEQQETAVKTLLIVQGFTEVPSRDIPLLDSAPSPGEFCGESKLGETRADLVIRLLDRRAVPVECKVSNSAVNSFKRINHEATGKARAWIDHFGRRQIVPCAIIHGVFNPVNLETAQSEGLAIIWSHRLQDLADFVGRIQKQ